MKIDFEGEICKLWVENLFRELAPAAENSAWAFEGEDPRKRRAEDFLACSLGFAFYHGGEREALRFLESELEDVGGDPRIREELRRRLQGAVTGEE